MFHNSVPVSISLEYLEHINEWLTLQEILFFDEVITDRVLKDWLTYLKRKYSPLFKTWFL